MRLLLVTIDFPLPADGGGVVRLLGLAEALSRHHDVHLLARERGPTPPSLVEALRDRLGGAPVETFPAPGRRAPGARAGAGRWTRSVIARVPPWVRRADSPALRSRAAALAAGFDVAVILDDNAAVYTAALTAHVPVILDKQNVKGWSFPRSTADWEGTPRRLLHRLASALYRSFEGRSSRQARLVVVTSPQEADRFANIYGWRPQCVPSAIPAPRAVANPCAAERAVVWLGDHTYAANVRGLLRFVHEGWPPLGAGGVRLLVAGRRPPAEVLALQAVPGVEVLGFVEDLDALIARAAAAVVPLWEGAGIKMKTLTLMGAGLPLAATPVALEGIGAVDDRHCRIAGNGAGLAAALGELLDDREHGALLGRAGRELVLAEHTWERVADRFNAVLREAVAGRPRAAPPDARAFG